MRISEYLEIKDGRVRCVKCNSELGSLEENFKLKAVMKKMPLTKASPLNRPTDKYIMREYYCPGCATLLEVEVVRRDEGVYWDRIKGGDPCTP